MDKYNCSHFIVELLLMHRIISITLIARLSLIIASVSLRNT